MKLLTLTDKEIFSDANVSKDVSYEFRRAVKVIIFDNENKLALVGTRYRLLPGGGVEEGESLQDAVIRESREEVGCEILVGKQIATTEEFRAKINRRQETHFFLATIVGEKGIPQTTQEDEQGIKVSWHNLTEATHLLEKEVEEISYKSYNSCFNVRTHLAVLRYLKNSAT